MSNDEINRKIAVVNYKKVLDTFIEKLKPLGSLD